jgi:predicted DNA-binding WGR domain protein
MNLADLERVDRNMLRFSTIRIAPTLFGEWAVVREWGRIGSLGHVYNVQGGQ